MSGRAITLTIPESLYERLAQRAAEAQRSVADEALEAMAMALPTSDDLPIGIAGELGALAGQDDHDLWEMTRRTLPRRASRRLRALSRLQQRQPLTPDEERELAGLLDQLEDIGLLRAKATALLRERGHDVSAVLPHA